MEASGRSGATTGDEGGTKEPKSLVWAWAMVVVGNLLLRHFEDGGAGWAGLAVGAVGVIAMPFSLVMGMKSANSSAARVVVLLFHVLAVGSYFYFAIPFLGSN